ncbi:hypothetical protein [Escherichia coli]
MSWSHYLELKGRVINYSPFVLQHP